MRYSDPRIIDIPLYANVHRLVENNENLNQDNIYRKIDVILSDIVESYSRAIPQTLEFVRRVPGVPESTKVMLAVDEISKAPKDIAILLKLFLVYWRVVDEDSTLFLAVAEYGATDIKILCKNLISIGIFFFNFFHPCISLKPSKPNGINCFQTLYGLFSEKRNANGSLLGEGGHGAVQQAIQFYFGGERAPSTSFVIICSFKSPPSIEWQQRIPGNRWHASRTQFC